MFAAIGASAAFCAPFKLAEDGKPCAEIVCAEDCPKPERTAAKDLAHWVKAISGAEIPVVSKPTGAQPFVVHVGASFARGRFDSDLDRLRDSDGYAIRRNGDELYLFGGRPRSAIFAASALLYDNTDIIWARPSVEFGAVFTPRATLAFEKTDKIDIPAMAFRGFNVVSIRRDHPTAEWVLRNGCNVADGSEGRGRGGELGLWSSMGGHTAWWLAHPKDYWPAHPEYYTYTLATDKRTPDMLCFTCDDLIELGVSNIVRKIGPNQPEMLLLGMRDTWQVCQCEKCRAPIVLKDGTVLECKSLEAEKDQPFWSTRFWLAVGKFAEKLQPAMPHTRLVGSGYFYGAEPPLCDLPDCLGLEFCPVGLFNDNYSMFDPEQRPRWRERAEKWSRKAHGKTFLYTYWGGAEGVNGLKRARTSYAPTLLETVEKFAGLGLETEMPPDSTRFYEGSRSRTGRDAWECGFVNHLVITRLMWNPKRSVDDIIDEIFPRVFHEAAPRMREFYAIVDNQRHDDSIRPKARTIFNSMDRDKAFAALKAAHAEAKHPGSRLLIGRMISHWERCRAASGVRVVPLAPGTQQLGNPEDPTWRDALRLPDFKLPPYYTWGRRDAPKATTTVDCLHDGKNLYLRVEAAATELDGDEVVVVLRPKARGGRVFRASVTAANATRKAPAGYCSVLAIPFDTLKLDIGNGATFPTYEIWRTDAATGEVSTPNGEFLDLKMGRLSF